MDKIKGVPNYRNNKVTFHHVFGQICSVLSKLNTPQQLHENVPNYPNRLENWTKYFLKFLNHYSGGPKIIGKS